MARGRIPATKVVTAKMIATYGFYPFGRCDSCPAKWKSKITDVKSGEVKERSCKDICVMAKGVRAI